MNLSDLYIAGMTMFYLLFIYNIYWVLKVKKIKKELKDKDITFCTYMYEATDGEKWRKRNEGKAEGIYNSNKYLILILCYIVVLFVVAITLTVLYLIMQETEIGRALLDIDLLKK